MRSASRFSGFIPALSRAPDSARPASAGASARKAWFSSSGERSKIRSTSGTAKCRRAMPFSPFRMLWRTSIVRRLRRLRTPDRSAMPQQSGCVKEAGGRAVDSAWRYIAGSL